LQLQKVAYFLITACAIVIILIYGKQLLIPFVFALLLWFIVRKIKQTQDRIKFVREKVPSWVKSMIATIVILFVLGTISKIISASITTLAESHSGYDKNFVHMIDELPDLFGFDLKDTLKNVFSGLNIGETLGTVFSSLTGVLSSTFMIILYALFIFLEETYFLIKIRNILNSQGKFVQFVEISERIESSIEKYLWLKTLMSLLTGAMSYLVLLIIGIDTPVFWAFLIFLLNYIPTVGSLIATLFPATYSVIQFGGLHEGIMIIVFIASIQVLVGNILEPRMMGHSMNISPLVTIISLAFWGAIWGVTGMFLCIPITVVFMIILSQFERTRPIAIMLSQKGTIET